MPEGAKFTDPDETCFQRFWKDLSIPVGDFMDEIRKNGEEEDAKNPLLSTETNLGRISLEESIRMEQQ